MKSPVLWGVSYNEELTHEMNERHREASIMAMKLALGVGLFSALVGGVWSASMKKGIWAGAVPGFLGGAFGVAFIYGVSQ